MNTKNILLVGAALVAAYFIFRKKPLLETAVVENKNGDSEIEDDKEPVMDIKPKPVEISGIIM